MLAAVQRSKVADEVVRRIISLIRSGSYVPGDRLPSERQLAEQFSVSRISVREALHRLETLGLLETRQARGTFVKQPSGEILQAALTPHLYADDATLWKLFELREIIEVEASGRAAQRASPEDIAAMRDWAQQLESCATRHDRDGLIQADVEFHRQIVVATGNDVLVSLMDNVADLLREMRYASTENPEVLPGQRIILVAIEAGEPEAARQAMRDHLKTVRAKAERYFSRKAENGVIGEVQAT